jgi:xanthine dehydrogenase accessory factor
MAGGRGMTGWIDDLSALAAAGNAAVSVTVASIRGSAPREAGAKMIVTRDQTIGTIGGGQLEYECTRIAVGMLGSNGPPATRRFPLGASMGQCCGGIVDVHFEPAGAFSNGWLEELRSLHVAREPATLVTRVGDDAARFVVSAERVFGAETAVLSEGLLHRARRLASSAAPAEWFDGYFLEPVAVDNFNVAVFGAGHVGSAVVRALSGLDCQIRWIDSRRLVFPEVPENVRAIESSQPALEVAAMPAGSFYLVMTHSHALDFGICESILERRDAAYCGLIGSASKRRRFEKRYEQQGMSRQLIDTLICPIGVDGISGKRPAEIAVATAAELLVVREQAMFAAKQDLARVRPMSA